MDWEVKHGNHLEWYLELEAEGKKVRALDSRPEIEFDLIPFWKAFSRLLNHKGITITDIKTYLDLMEITDFEEKEDYIFYLMNLSREFLSRYADRA